MTKNETGYAKVPTWLQDQAAALGIGPNGIAVYAALYTCADWRTGITTGASIARIARLSGIGSRNTASATIEALRRARVLEIKESRRNRAHVYRIALTERLPGAQDLSTQHAFEHDITPPEEPASALGAQDLRTRWSESEHPGAQDLSTIRRTDLSRSLKADPSGMAGAKPDQSGDSQKIGHAVSSDEQTNHLASDGSAAIGLTSDLPSTKRGAGRRVPRRASRAQILWVRDLRAMTGTGTENADPLTVEKADEEIRDLWAEVERRRHNGEPLDGNYWDLSQRARAYADKHDLDIDRREAS
ncbi:hypothetical protein L2X99_14075 [Microbacterium sp. KUDC0406]|uniref:hypothetical protein n=1 Tax=Microbacterium sp. KUDC0406 TaxID=2909588 RepID=UPI001F47635C|nr:hypothetical protein [Microbacterium sp. KUDC0406]UJP09538.1 hypothetical protein L2X99_14075 [Microbacterium sp. KUDC0406]